MPYAAQFEEMKRFVRFGKQDELLLAELCSHARPHFHVIAREFYERNREHEEAHAVFEDDAQIERLHHSLVAWLERVLSGPYDDAYCRKSLEIGRVHVRVGLPQRFMFTAMALFRMRLQGIAIRTMGDRAHAACEALTRVLDIEQGLMNETYLEAALARAKRVEEEQRQISLRGMELLGRRYVDAVELAGAILIGLDPQGLIQIFNREAQRVTGYTRDEVSGKSFVEMFVVDRQPFDDAWAAAEQGGTVDLSFALKSRAHRVREIAAELTMGAGLPDADVIHILAGQDVTHERAMAAQLRQSERLAAVGTLAAGLAHEIRNPLNGAQLHLTYLRRAIERQKLNGDLSETVDVVVDEVKRLSTLVSEFLSFARPGEIVRKPAVMQEIAKRSFSLVASRDKDVELSLQVPDSDITAEVDPGRIEQVILNLLTNAVDAACGGVGSKVVLRLLREPRSCVIEVEDDGPGLPSPDAPIFDAFYSTKAGGTGLGLAIVHRIVTDHDGVIEVKSGPGRTLFRVRLPLEASGRADSTPLPPPVLERKS